MDVDDHVPVGVRQIDEDETVSELVEAHRRIMMNESRLELMRSLLQRGLCTRDIYAFACSQADLCVTTSDPDRSTVKCAMKRKIRDIIQTIKMEHRKRRQKEKELLRQYGGKSWRLRKKIQKIKIGLRQEHDLITKKYQNKINHYVKTMERLDATQQSVVMNGMNKPPSGGGG